MPQVVLRDGRVSIETIVRREFRWDRKPIVVTMEFEPEVGFFRLLLDLEMRQLTRNILPASN